LALACSALFIGTWIDKGMGLISGGFIPTPLHKVVDYVPTLPELLISLGVAGLGILILTLLLKIAVTVKEQNQSANTGAGINTIYQSKS
jgi:molybdopterin-containing oxidoreductase family membrane subunit